MSIIKNPAEFKQKIEQNDYSPLKQLTYRNNFEGSYTEMNVHSCPVSKELIVGTIKGITLTKGENNTINSKTHLVIVNLIIPSAIFVEITKNTKPFK